MRGRGATGVVVEELVWTEILCRGGGCRGGTGALRGRVYLGVRAHLSLCVEHHLLIGPLSELGVGGRIKVMVLSLVRMERVGLCRELLVLVLVK